MPDVRELAILNPKFVMLRPQGPLGRLIGDARMALRRFVVRTARLPGFRTLYRTLYALHLRALRRLALAFRDTHAVYLTAGVGRGEVRLGISDIDFVILGDWPEKTYFRMLACFAVMVIALPLFDRESLGSLNTWQDLLRMNNTDLFFAYQYATAKSSWKLLWGQDLIQALPDLSPDRRAGAAQFDMGCWWGAYLRSALGSGVVARDSIFRNSLSFKAVADLLRAECIARGETPPRNRRAILSQFLEDGGLRTRLLDSEAADFLKMDGDPRTEVFTWMLRRLEHWNAGARAREGFAPIAAVRILAEPSERLISPALAKEAASLASAARTLPGFEAAYLAPSSIFFAPDTLAIFLRFDSHQLPSLDQLRALLEPHVAALLDESQRIPIYLLLDHGAYTLDATYGLEIWSWTLAPHFAPAPFALLRPEFLLCGDPRTSPPPAHWSAASQEILAEELMIRRAAHTRFGASSRPTPIENLRNLWRLLQLMIMEQRGTDGTVTIPLSLEAIAKEAALRWPPLSADLALLLDAFRTAFTGQPVAVDAVMQRVLAWALAQRGPEAEADPPSVEPAAGS
jgi:hypothetical protein